MARYDEEFAVVIEGLDGIALSLGRNLLDAAGVPSLAHGPDFDVAELGRAAHDQIRGGKLLVPRPLLERAREVLRAAWGDELVPPAHAAE